MAKPKLRTVEDFVKELKALGRTDTEILIVASCTRWEPHKAEVAAICGTSGVCGSGRGYGT